MGTLLVTLIVWVVFLSLTSNLQVFNLGVGLIVAFFVSRIFSLRFRKISIGLIPQALLAFLQYCFILVIDLIGSGVQVARIVFNPELPINPGIIAIPVRCDTELANALSAHAITLTPGQLVIEMDEHGVMYTHVLDISQEKDMIRHAQTQRRDLLRRIFL